MGLKPYYTKPLHELFTLIVEHSWIPWCHWTLPCIPANGAKTFISKSSKLFTMPSLSLIFLLDCEFWFGMCSIFILQKNVLHVILKWHDSDKECLGISCIMGHLSVTSTCNISFDYLTIYTIKLAYRIIVVGMIKQRCLTLSFYLLSCLG